MSETSSQKIIMVHAPTTDISEYAQIADEAVRLKPYGRVLMLAGCLADKWFDCLPEGGSPWHEYASYNPTLFNFFPHPDVAPHVDADLVKRNQAFLQEQRKVLNARGLEAWFYAVEPSFISESFFEAFPQWRGPRVDHPRRATVEAFAMCLDLPEVQERYAWMTAELIRHAPEIAAITFKVNDAGSGFCWAKAQYMGPNGPQHCRGRSAGERFRDFSLTLQRGAKDGGREVLVYNTASNFWDGELDEIRRYLPPNTIVLPGNPDVLNLGGLMGATYPVMGLLDPLRLFEAMEKWSDPKVDPVFFHFRASYDRAHETLDTIEKVIDIFEDCVAEGTDGWFSRVEKLRALSKKWAGKNHADTVARAFIEFDQVLRLAGVVAARARPMYAGVSMRHITRPLLIRPEVLDPKEESHFLPHVFNIRESEARTDYIDLHGNRMHMDADDCYYCAGVMRCVKDACAVAAKFEEAADGPEGKWLSDIALSIRMWASILRSSHNFYGVQKIRDDYADVLAGEPVVPEKRGTVTGHRATLPYYYLLRDELDNTAELIAVLERGGIERIRTAADAEHEDTFLLGPDLVDQLRRKIKIMRDHWRDAEWYLPPPHK